MRGPSPRGPPAVAQRDRAALVAIEDPLLGSETQDAPAASERHSLNHPGARGVPCGLDRDGLVDPFGVRPAMLLLDILLADGDDERGRGATDRGQIAGCRRDRENHREGVVLPL